MHMSPFGHLAEFLRPHARYVVPNKFRDTLGKTLATQNEMLALGLPTSQHGVMDIFVQHMLVQYSTGQHLVLVAPPRVMLGKTAGHILNTIDSVLGSRWSLQRFAEMDKFI